MHKFLSLTKQRSVIRIYLPEYPQKTCCIILLQMSSAKSIHLPLSSWIRNTFKMINSLWPNGINFYSSAISSSVKGILSAEGQLRQIFILKNIKKHLQLLSGNDKKDQI